MTTINSARHIIHLLDSNRSRLHVILNVAAIIMALSFLAWPALAKTGRVLPVGTDAPDFHAVTFDNAGIQLSDYAGKRPVLIVFYDLGCTASYNLATRLNDAAKLRPDVSVLVVNAKPYTLDALRDWVETVTANPPHNHDDWLAFANAPRRIWQPLIDPKAEIAAKFHIPGSYPALVFIGQDGSIKATRFGEHTNDNLMYRINTILPLRADWRP